MLTACLGPLPLPASAGADVELEELAEQIEAAPLTPEEDAELEHEEASPDPFEEGQPSDSESAPEPESPDRPAGPAPGSPDTAATPAPAPPVSEPPPQSPADQPLATPDRPPTRAADGTGERDATRTHSVRLREAAGEPAGAATPAATPARRRQAAAAAPATARAEGRRLVYIVSSGDTLWSIARASLGPAASPAAIATEVERLWRLNAGRIASGDPDLVFPGQVLVIG